MKKVNVKLYAILYKLNRVINKKLDEMKKDLIEGAETTFKDYADIKVVDCIKRAYSKEDQAILDLFAKEQGLQKIETRYKRVDIDHINDNADNVVTNIVEQLETSNDKTIVRVASKVATRK